MSYSIHCFELLDVQAALKVAKQFYFGCSSYMQTIKVTRDYFILYFIMEYSTA